ncbi:MAG: MarR family transcriptional regulator [Nanoarchaeota archaeon]
MKFNTKTLGGILATFAVILLVLLIFVKVNVDSQAAFLCETVAANGGDLASCPAHRSPISWFIVSSFGIVFLMLGAGAYMFLMPMKTEQQILPAITERQKFKEVDFSKLNEEEKKIYDLIKVKEGSIYQTDLIKETNFSKVKMSRLLDKMEQKGIIERKRRGMTNIVVLK